MRVQIIYPTDEWVLQRLAEPLIEELPYVEGMAWRPDLKSSWDISYYVNYALYEPHGRINRFLPRDPRSRIKGGFFTHRENESFDRIARTLDFCVSPCIRYRDYILANCNTNAHVIYHGVDLQRFKPKLRLGFVGKRKRDRRKGDDMLEFVARLPFVELLATEGRLSREEVPGFYQAIDYVLITSTAEGGPLCFQEGLASGKEVISTDVGMVSEFAGAAGVHIFETREQLEALLQAKLAERNRLRTQIERYTIDYWVEEHDALFRRLLSS